MKYNRNIFLFQHFMLAILLIFFPFAFHAQSINKEFSATLTLHELKDTAEIQKKINQIKSWSISHPDSALKAWERVYKESILLKYEYGCISSLIGSANTLIQQRVYEKSIPFLNLALKHCNETNHPELLATIYNNLGGIYSYLSQHKLAVDNFLLALKYKRKYPNSNLAMSSVYNNLGGIFLDLQEMKKSLDFLDTAYYYAVKDSNTSLIISSLQNKGGYYITTKKFAESEKYLREAVQIAENHTSQSTLFRAYVSLGNLFKIEKQNDSALAYLLKANALYQNEKVEKHGYNMLLCFIGEVYTQSGNFNTAQYYYNLVENDLNKTPAEHAYLLAKWAEFYEAKAEYKKAYQFKSAYHRLNDSLRNAEIAIKISSIESRYELAQKNEELYLSKVMLAEQQLKTQKRNIWLWLIAGISLIGLSAGMLIYRNKQKKYQTEKYILSLKSKMKGEEQEKERIAHELHDGVNSQLTAIKSFLISTQKKLPEVKEVFEFSIAQNLLSETSDEVRNIAHNLLPDNFLKQGFLSVVQSFCEKLFTTVGIQYHIDTIGDFTRLPQEMAFNTYRIIQELCNNIVKHAKAKQATIVMTIIDDKFNLIVEDDGIGLAATESQHKGIGMANIKERVEMFGGTLHIESTPGQHTTFNITFPLSLL